MTDTSVSAGADVSATTPVADPTVVAGAGASVVANRLGVVLEPIFKALEELGVFVDNHRSLLNELQALVKDL